MPDEKLIASVREKVANSIKIKDFKNSKDELGEYYFTYEETTSKPYHTDTDEILIYTSDKKIKKLSEYIKDTKNELGEVLLNSEFARYVFIVPKEIEL